MRLSRIEKEVLLCDALGLDIEELLAHPELADEENPDYKKMVKRIEADEPLAYVLENQPFLGLEFKVNNAVLIPRPETEELTELALNLMKSNKGKISILDLGTGSGVIAVTLCRYLKNASAWAVDISKKALKVARENAKTHCVEDRLTILQGDLFAPINDRDFDLIISNPPYIPSPVLKTLELSVKDHEPRKALDGGKDGLAVIKRMLKESPKYLKPEGLLLLEIGHDQGKQVKQLAQKSFKEAKLLKDICGKDRFLKACEPIKRTKKA